MATPQQILIAAIKAWRTSLVNLDGRNPLLFFKSTVTAKGIPKPKKGIVDFRVHEVDQSKLALLLDGRATQVSTLHPSSYETRQKGDLVPESVEEIDWSGGKEKKTTAWGKLITSYEEIVRKAKENLDEKNIETLYLVRGFVTWKTEGPGPSEPMAPLILVPLKIESKGRGHTDFSISTNGEPIFNDALKLYMQSQMSIDISSLGILDELDFEDLTSIKKNFAPFLKELNGGKFLDIELIGNFSFYKLPLVADMDRILDQGAMHPILRALAGDESALKLVSQEEDFPEIERINEIDPKDEYLVFPTDRSQHLAVAAITRGKTIVIQGPPGTGKSQTIANAIAELSAMGKKVLFVAEKRAAIEAVISRLDSQGLTSLVLDLHKDPDKKSIAAQLLAVLYESTRKNSDLRASDAELRATRDKLQKRWSELQQLSEIELKIGEKLTYYEAFTLLGKLIEQNESWDQWPALIDRKLLSGLEIESVRDSRKTLNTLSELRWIDAKNQHAGRALLEYVKNQEQALEVTTSLNYLNQNALTKLLQHAERYCNDNGIVTQSLNELHNHIEANLSLSKISGLFDLPAFVDQWHQYESRWTFADLKKIPEFSNPLKRYFESVKRSKTLRRATRKSNCKRSEILTIHNSLLTHSQISDGTVLIPKNCPEILVHLVEEVSEHLKELNHYGPLLRDLSRISLGDLSQRIQILDKDALLIAQLPTISILRAEFAQKNELASRILSWLEEDQLIDGSSGDWFLRHWLNQYLDLTITKTNRELGLSELGSLDRVLQRYQDLDSLHISNNAFRAHSRVKDRVMEISNTEGFSKLRREADKKSSHHPFRILMEEARTEVLTLKPCFAMSPISVSRLIPCEMGIFDVVIFDEASQIPPEDSIPSIYRAKQVVVAGDKFQLGPTDIGRSGEDAEYDYEDEIGAELATAGLESILDSLRGVLPLSNTYALQTHYRSQDERLITFSNKAFYIPNNQGLYSFPSREANPRKALGYEYVDKVQTKSMREEPNVLEIEKVIEEVLRHVAERPNDTLGIIAFGDQHKRRIEDRLLRLERENDNYFDYLGRFSATREPLFVKSIERVQGDERDCIILTPGYARGEKGTLRFQFGSLGRQGGERRLNVAASRAKKKLTLITSIKADDFGGYSGSERGVKLFKTLLQYMESSGLAGDLGDAPSAPENPFEEQILHYLTRQGLKVDCQVGDSGYRIDFAIRHPSRDDEYVLAIEADGASYHSSDYARERDIVRQRVLESRGWDFVRIWSTDWFRNKEAELEKVLAAYKTAIAGSIRSPEIRSVPSTHKDIHINEDHTPIDEKLFRGLRQSKPQLSREAFLEEWMQLCGKSKKTSALLERFNILWKGDSLENYTRDRRKDRKTELIGVPRDFKQIIWISITEIETCRKAMISLEDTEVPGQDGAVVSVTLDTRKKPGAKYLTIQRKRNSKIVTLPEIEGFEVLGGLDVLQKKESNFYGDKTKKENSYIEFLTAQPNLGFNEPSIKIYRKS